MSDLKNKKHLGYEILGLALFLGGAFFVVSAGMSRGDGGADTLNPNPTTDAILSLLDVFGFVPFLAASVGAASLGAVMFVRPAPLSLRLPVTMIATYSVALSILSGVFGATAGGSIGAWLPAAIGGFAGGVAAFVLGLGIALLGTWLALGMPALPKSKKAGELNSVAAALREEEVDGVSNAEAAALFPEDLPPPAAAPGVREYELRARGELPEGVKPLDAPSYEAEVPQSDLQPEVRESGAALVLEPAEPASRDLAEAEPVQAELSEGLWVREEESELTDSPEAPSWETAALEAEALEPTDAIAEDGERFDEFEVEVPLEPLEPSGELEAETPEFLGEEVEAELEADEEEADLELAAELDDDDDEDVEEDEIELVEADEEPEASEAEAEVESSEEPEVEQVAAELEDDDEEEEEGAEDEVGLAEVDEEPEASEIEAETESSEEPEAEQVAAELEGDEVDETPELAAALDDEDDAEEDVEQDEVELAESDEEPEASEAEVEQVIAELEDDEDDQDDEDLELAAEQELGALVDVFEGAEAEPEPQEESELAEPATPVEQRGLFDGHDEALEVSVATEAPEETQAAVELEQVELTPQAPLDEADDEANVGTEATEEAVEEPVAEASPAEPTVELTREELVYRAGLLFLEEGRVAVSMLQRRFELEFSTATEVLDELQAMGLIGPYLGGSRRDILMDIEAWEASAAAR